MTNESSPFLCQLDLAPCHNNYRPIIFQRFCVARTSLLVSFLARCHLEFSPILAGQLSSSKKYSVQVLLTYYLLYYLLYCVMVSSCPILAGQLSSSKKYLPPTQLWYQICHVYPLAQYNLHYAFCKLIVFSCYLVCFAPGIHDNICTRLTVVLCIVLMYLIGCRTITEIYIMNSRTSHLCFTFLRFTFYVFPFTFSLFPFTFLMSTVHG